MGWVNEQIRAVKQSDQDAFEESLLRMGAVVLGDKKGLNILEDRLVTKNAIDQILKFFHFKPVELPDSVRGGNEQMEYCLRPYGIMKRRIKLRKGWYHASFGPVLAFRKNEGTPVTLLPRPFQGYWMVDPDTGKKTILTGKISAELEEDALCFYKPLPTKKLGIRDLIHYLGTCLAQSDYILLIVMTALGTLVGMLIPYITRTMTGFVLMSRMPNILIATTVAMISVTISQLLISMVRGLASNRMIIKGGLQMESALMMRLINLPTSFFRGYSAGELSTRFQYISGLTNMLINDVYGMIVSSVMSLVYIFQIANFTPALAVPAILLIVGSLVISVITSLMQMKISRKSMELNTKISGLTFSLISGIQKIKLAGAEKRVFAKWGNQYSKSANLSYNLPFFLKYSTLFTSALTLVGTMVLYSVAVRSGVTPSEYIAFNSAYGMVAGAFASIAGVALNIARIKPVFEMVEPILKTEPETSADKEMVLSLKGNIELSNVYFRYNDSMPFVVDGMNLKIRAGEYIALVGTTGCGKSTLLRLLLGFETPDKGSVYYDGKDMSKLDKQSLRRHIGAVTQDGGLFQGSIYSNIVISDPSLTYDDAWEAAEIAGIADDIRSMPMKMHTMVSEGQGGLSGGQKQRLMIARAVAPKPSILMFDEATSALDNKTQKQVSEALDRMKCTRIVIAHRLSTIKNCDRILMLDKGRIVEDGTYDELIAKNGRFADLVARQRLD